MRKREGGKEAQMSLLEDKRIHEAILRDVVTANKLIEEKAVSEDVAEQIQNCIDGIETYLSYVHFEHDALQNLILTQKRFFVE